jgi:7-cyano-7-deazaguanine synthase
VNINMMMPNNDDRAGAVSVLCSGGLDSAVLCAEMLRQFEQVYPIYVRFGLRWEATELSYLASYVAEVALASERLMPLVVLDEPVASVYGGHWSIAGGHDVPGADTDDDAVYLPGRNILLSAKAAIWCRLHDVQTLCFGTLKSNPYADSTPAFFQELEAVLNRALGGRLRIIRPFESLSKLEVIRRGSSLPLHLTFSCLDPVDGKHCGRCNKCAERRRGYRAAGCPDKTCYAAVSRDASG